VEWILFYYFIRQDLQDIQDFLFFFTSRKEVKKPNPLSAENYFFSINMFAADRFIMPNVYLIACKWNGFLFYSYFRQDLQDLFFISHFPEENVKTQSAFGGKTIYIVNTM